MKKVAAYLSIFALVLTSCSKNEAGLNEEKSLLESFKITKNLQGRYSIDYDVNTNVTSEVVKNHQTNSNDIYLFSGKNSTGESFSEALLLENDMLQIGFLENNEKRKSIIIEDQDIVLAKGEESTEYLEQYSIEDLGNNEYELSFSVKDGISTSFQYNEDLGINEVHFQQGVSTGKSFSKRYVKTNDVLKIDFVNYLSTDVSARQTEIVELAERPRRPRVIIQD